MWRTEFESSIKKSSMPNKPCRYWYCKWWLFIILNHPQQSMDQNDLIFATIFCDGTDLRRSPHCIIRFNFINVNIILIITAPWEGFYLEAGPRRSLGRKDIGRGRRYHCNAAALLFTTSRKQTKHYNFILNYNNLLTWHRCLDCAS